MVAESKNSIIKALLHKHELTIEMLAHALNISVSTINRLLLGPKSDPKLSSLKPIAKFFGVSIDELVGLRPLALKPGTVLEDLDLKHCVFQVPIIYWEQIKEAESLVPALNSDVWDKWVVIADDVDPDSYAIIIEQHSLPAPFYFKTIIVIDPTRIPLDSDYVLVLHKENPILCRYTLNGLEKCYQSLHLNQIYKHDEINLCGTLVQWTIPYHEKRIT